MAVIAALVLSSPDEKAVTLQQWARQNPADFVTTAVTELDGTSTSASYGPPYNHAGTGQSIFFLHLQKWAGVRLPVNSAVDFVLAPLSTVTGNPALSAALAVYRNASATQQQAWASAYDTAIAKAPGNDPAKVAPGNYGPVPAMTAALLRMAQSGNLQSQLVNQSQRLLPGRLHQTAPVPGRRRLPGRPGRRPASGRRPVGHDERDRQLPRPSLAVAVHLLVPDLPVQDLRQRRRPGVGDHDDPVPRPHPGAPHPRPALATTMDTHLQDHLARLLPGPPPDRRRQRNRSEIGPGQPTL